ncbi:RNA polymerase sigma factor [Sphingopyxis sp.]|uniref:RNA polymerase sigma factor n=1 Tax=Sphingopyxis sp. TaxID=1908224 RepID=UPI002D77DB19|nr:sigma-70 family RNA polymerase sigma factor [Sphingopyxis sp.]HET6523788.1 sigma-70 family RNA polymerase sigma factor [Sphingopyxis sp.]
MARTDDYRATFAAARPRAMAALLRYFRDLDRAEDAFQEACVRALSAWPRNSPPRDATGWLILVGRNAQVDALRRQQKVANEAGGIVADTAVGGEPDMIERLDQSHFRDDILRLLFTCCHRDLPPAQQIAVALRVISGLSVVQISRAFLVSEAAMEQRITRAKARIAKAELSYEAPGALERVERLAAVGKMLYLLFNEGYTAADPASDRATLCAEAIRLVRLLLEMFPAEPELMGLLALMLLQHSRAAARFDAGGSPILLDDQDRRLWNRDAIGEGIALIDKAMRHRAPGPYQIQAAIAALHARAESPADTDWHQIDQLYQALERHAPSPVTTLNRAVAVARLRGAAAALEMIAPLSEALDGYFYYHGVRGIFLKEIGHQEEARRALLRAMSLASTPAEAVHVRREIELLEHGVVR